MTKRNVSDDLYDPRNGDPAIRTQRLDLGRRPFEAVGSFLVFVTSFVTLSFLITTPECWVPPLGDAQHGFPYLSGAGRIVIKDAIMMGAALVTMADSAKAYLRKRAASHSPSSAPVTQERLTTASV